MAEESGGKIFSATGEEGAGLPAVYVNRFYGRVSEGLLRLVFVETTAPAGAPAPERDQHRAALIMTPENARALSALILHVLGDTPNVNPPSH